MDLDIVNFEIYTGVEYVFVGVANVSGSSKLDADSSFLTAFRVYRRNFNGAERHVAFHR